MAEDPVVRAFETFSLLGVLLAFIIFTRLAVIAKKHGIFRLQLCAFILLWVLGEIPHIASTLGLVSTTGYEGAGLALHDLSMATFALFVGARYFNLLRAFHRKSPMGRDESQTSTPIRDFEVGPGPLR